MTESKETIPARKGKAAHVRKGQVIKIINTHGQQVVDTWAFNAHDTSEFMSMEHSRAMMRKIMPAIGDSLVTNHRRAILTVVEDTTRAFMTRSWRRAIDTATSSSESRDTTTRLYAARRWSVLIILQGMDTSGKGGTIKHVLSGVNPQGVAVTSFSGPGPEELAHDFLWRIHRALPMRGQIGIFDRSHYEEVLVVRVHPELLAKQSLPDEVAGKHLCQHRLEDIAAFERYLARQGTLVLKFFLNLSKEEQRTRLLARLAEPDKHWKFDAGDLAARSQWERYMAAFEAAIAATAAPHAPWLVPRPTTNGSPVWWSWRQSTTRWAPLT